MRTLQEFNNIYSLSKTLRFELKPIGNTQQMLEQAQVFKKDKTIKEKYINTKPYIDRLHQDFIVESLSNVKLSALEKYHKALIDFRKDKHNKVLAKTLENCKKELRKGINSIFNLEAKVVMVFEGNWSYNKPRVGKRTLLPGKIPYLIFKHDEKNDPHFFSISSITRNN